MSKEQMISVIEQQGVLPLFYHDDAEVCVSVMDALYKAGIKAVEFTNRGGYALPNFTNLASLVNATLARLTAWCWYNTKHG